MSSNDPVSPEITLPFDFYVADAVETSTVNANGQYSFDDTGVALDLSGVSGSSTVTTLRFDDKPTNTDGIDASQLASAYHWYIVQDGPLSFDASSALRFLRTDIPSPGFDNTNDSSIDAYSRASFESGAFSSLSTSYDDGGHGRRP